AEEAALLAPLLQGKAFALVSEASHLPRALPLFTARGLAPLPAPAMKMSSPDSDWRLEARAALKSERAFYEGLGRLWQWLRHGSGGYEQHKKTAAGKTGGRFSLHSIRSEHNAQIQVSRINNAVVTFIAVLHIIAGVIQPQTNGIRQPGIQTNTIEKIQTAGFTFSCTHLTLGVPVVTT